MGGVGGMSGWLWRIGQRRVGMSWEETNAASVFILSLAPSPRHRMLAFGPRPTVRTRSNAAAPRRVVDRISQQGMERPDGTNGNQSRGLPSSGSWEDQQTLSMVPPFNTSRGSRSREPAKQRRDAGPDPALPRRWQGVSIEQVIDQSMGMEPAPNHPIPFVLTPRVDSAGSL